MPRGTNSKPTTAFETFNEVISNETRKKKDFLYLMVKMIGPSKVGKLINSNSDTSGPEWKNPVSSGTKRCYRLQQPWGFPSKSFGQIL